ncbi:MAG: hypothetical protein M0Q95_11700 [Porticoccaceae bacterium]|nr:hypothetical protein [Porticoccaceae bacterium]
MNTNGRTLWQIFAVPFWVGVISFIGLIAALVGDGVFDGISWLALGIPIILVVHFNRRASKNSR